MNNERTESGGKIDVYVELMRVEAQNYYLDWHNVLIEADLWHPCHK